MKPSTKTRLWIALFFAIGLGLGGVGGFLLNDYAERENPDTIQQMRQEFQTQNQLDELFARQRDQANTAREAD